MLSNPKQSAHAAVFRHHKREVLLVQRDDIPMWVLPGGHRDSNEELKQTAVREFREETGYDVVVTDLVATYKSKDGKTEKYLYLGILAGGEAATGAESRRIEWWPVKHLPPGVTLYETRRIRDCLLFTGETLQKEYQVSFLQETLHLLKNPIVFITFLCYSFRNFIVRNP